MFGLGATEITLIVIAILILFGAKKIPEFARGLGQGIREFKNAMAGIDKLPEKKKTDSEEAQENVSS